MHPLLPLLPFLTLSPSAQDPPATPAPAESIAPVLRIETHGPAAWRNTFLPTNVGAMMSSEDGERLWRPWVSRLEATVRGMAGEAEYQAARTRLLGYGGVISAQVWLRVESHATRAVCRLWAEDDGHTDLQALAAELTRGLDRMLGAQMTETAGEREVKLWRRPDGWLTVPAVHQGHLGMVLGDFEDLALALDTTASRPIAGQLHDGVLHLQWNIDALRRVLGDDATENAITHELGFDALDVAGVTIGTSGPRARIDLDLRFGDAPRGLFGALFPERAGVPALRHLVPAEMEQWKVGRLDARAVYETVETAMAAFDASGDAAKFRADVTKELGFDPVDDLLAHATDEVLLFGDVPLPRDLDEERGVDWGIAVRLRDGTAFAPHWFALLEHAGPSLQVQERYEHRGTAVRRLGGMFMPTFHTAVTGRLLLLAFGPEARTRLTAMLDADVDNAEQPELPGRLREVWSAAPAGLNGLALIDFDTLLGRQLLTFLDNLDRSILMVGLGEQVESEALRDTLDVLLPLLLRHGLDRTCSMTGCSVGRWTFRAFW